MATPINLTLVDTNLFTLDEDDNSIEQYTDGDIANSKNFIGQKKRLQWRFSSDYTLEGLNLFMNFALFVPAGFVQTFVDAGPRYWTVNFPVGGAVNIDYTAEFVGGQFPHPGKNYKVVVRKLAGNTFRVRLDYYQTYDCEAYIDPGNDSNVERLLKNIWYNPERLVNNLPSVYNEAREARVYVFAQDPTNPDNKGSIESKAQGIAAKFYGETYADGDLTDMAIKLYYDGVEVDSLKKLDGGTDVVVTFKTIHSVNRITATIIRVDRNENVMDFVTNYELESKRIVAGGSDGEKITGPYEITFDGSGNYTARFKVSPDNLEDGASYRIMVGVSNPEREVGVGIGDPVDVDYGNPYVGNGIDFIGVLCDIQSEFSGNDLECVVEERMKSKLKLNYFADKYKNDIFNRLGLVIVNDIRRYLTKVEFTIFDEAFSALLGGTLRNVYDYRVSNKVNPLSYSGSDLNLGFNTDFSEFSAEWRNRYEAGTDCFQSLLNGANFLPKQSNQYWGGRTLKVEWKLSFYYDDYVNPFTDELIFTQQIRVKDYEPEIISIVAQDEADEDKEFFCNGDPCCLQSELNLVYDDESKYALITTIDPNPGNISTIEENEEWVPEEMAQQTTNKFKDQEIMYSETETGVSKFCIDTNKLLLNSQYKVSAMAKYFVERCRRVIETGEPRIIETGETRIPESCQ